MHLADVGVAELPQFEVDDHQAAQTTVEEQEVDPVPLVADSQTPLPADEGEVLAQLQQERLQVPDQSLFQVGLGVFVLQSQELQDERVLDLLLRRHRVFRSRRRSLAKHGGLVPREQRPLVELRGNLPVELPYRPPAPQGLGFIERPRVAVMHRQQLEVVRPR